MERNATSASLIKMALQALHRENKQRSLTINETIRRSLEEARRHADYRDKEFGVLLLENPISPKAPKSVQYITTSPKAKSVVKRFKSFIGKENG